MNEDPRHPGSVLLPLGVRAASGDGGGFCPCPCLLPPTHSASLQGLAVGTEAATGAAASPWATGPGTASSTPGGQGGTPGSGTAGEVSPGMGPAKPDLG